MIFKNEKELKNYLLAKSKIAVTNAENKVFRIIDGCLNKFYSEFSPNEYIRTQQLLHSLVRSGIKPTGDGFEAEVYFDVSKLNYQTGVVQTQHGTGYATWDGQKVLDVTMTDELPHGRYASGTAIWSVSMNLLGDILDLLLRELKAQGISIR